MARERVEITLPVALPSWNRLLSVTHFTRKKIRKLVHQIVEDAVEGKETPEWILKEYMSQIRPSKKNKVAAAKAKRKHARSVAKRKQ